MSEKRANLVCCKASLLFIKDCTKSFYPHTQIAEKMFLSVNTLKIHMMNSFYNIGMKSRTAAVGRARELMQ